MAIVDLGLPDGNGIDVIREFQGISPRVLIVVASGGFEGRSSERPQSRQVFSPETVCPDRIISPGRRPVRRPRPAYRG
jgi:hypothetical protein